MKRFLLPLLIAASAHAELQIVFDYTYDTEGFFTGANSIRQTYLQNAADYVTGILSPTFLDGITPGGSNTWSASFFDPGTGAVTSASNLTIATDTVLIYAGARELGGSTLGSGGAGGFSSSGVSGWGDQIRYRGNGSYSTGWGGSLAFDISTSWHFDDDIWTLESFPSQFDFFSVAIHEIAHVLGFGTSNTWDSLINTSTSPGTFTGLQSVALTGGEVPLSAGDSHWATGTMSGVFGFETIQEASMDPNISSNTRKYFTDLDVAGLQDIGYTAVPEARDFGVLLLAGLLAIIICGRRRGSAGMR